MSQQAKNSPSYSEDISLYGLLSLFLKNWFILMATAVFFAGAAAAWSLTQSDVYTSEVVLMPAEQDSGGLGGLAGNLGGLAAMAGVNVPQGKSDNTKLALELLKSKGFIGQFIDENELLLPLMAARGWDLATDTLLYKPDVYDKKSSKWVRKFQAPKKAKPSLQEAHLAFMKLIKVEQDPKTKFVKLSVDFYSPYLAAQWANKLVESLNKHIRKIDLDESNNSIDYLQTLIAESQVSGLRTIFSSLMEEQIKSKMLASIRPDYVFKVVDPAIAAEQKSKPVRSLIVIVIGFFGGIFGLIIVLFREGRKAHLSKLAVK